MCYVWKQSYFPAIFCHKTAIQYHLCKGNGHGNDGKLKPQSVDTGYYGDRYPIGTDDLSTYH